MSLWRCKIREVLTRLIGREPSLCFILLERESAQRRSGRVRWSWESAPASIVSHSPIRAGSVQIMDNHVNQTEQRSHCHDCLHMRFVHCTDFLYGLELGTAFS